VNLKFEIAPSQAKIPAATSAMKEVKRKLRGNGDETPPNMGEQVDGGMSMERERNKGEKRKSTKKKKK
jgi:hypothetical protein